MPGVFSTRRHTELKLLFNKLKSRLDSDEISFIKSIAGEGINKKKIDFEKIKTIRLSPGAYKLRIHNFSFPMNVIGIPDKPLSTAYKKSILIHEIIHQFQYALDVGSFRKLMKEQLRYRTSKEDVYEYGMNEFMAGTKKIEILEDILYYEARAKFVQDFTYEYLLYKEWMQDAESAADEKAKKKQMGEALSYKSQAAKYAGVLFKSGLESVAIDELVVS